MPLCVESFPNTHVMHSSLGNVMSLHAVPFEPEGSPNLLPHLVQVLFPAGIGSPGANVWHAPTLLGLERGWSVGQRLTGRIGTEPRNLLPSQPYST